MGFASRKSDNGLAPISRAPSSGVRPRVLPVGAANDTELESVSSFDAAPPVLAPREVDAVRPQVADIEVDDELQLEDAVPLPTDAALAVVLGFVVVAASGLVFAFSAL